MNIPSAASAMPRRANFGELNPYGPITNIAAETM
jgi:hypothetical protein